MCIQAGNSKLKDKKVTIHAEAETMFAAAINQPINQFNQCKLKM